MSLVMCSECGKEISDKSMNCIHCGCPLNETLKSNPEWLMEQFKGDRDEINRKRQQGILRSLSSELQQAVNEIHERYFPDEKMINLKICPFCAAVNPDKTSPGYLLNQCGICKNDLSEIEYTIDDFERNSANDFKKENAIKRDIYENYIESMGLIIDDEKFQRNREIYYGIHGTATMNYEAQIQKMAQQMKREENITRHQSDINNVPKCLTCKSTNVSRISNAKRISSISLFGLFSNKINKSFKCNNCGYTW